MKRCKKCGAVKPMSDFHRDAAANDGRRNECKVCNLAAQTAKRRANPQANRDRVRQWQRANPEKVAARRAAYVASGWRSISNRKSHLKRRFGLTLEQYDEMLRSQGGGCALCGRAPREGKALHVDHDHETGRVRGLLCFTCNNALGDFEDDPVRLREAARYVEAFEPSLEPLIRKRLDELKAMTPAWERAEAGR